MNLHSPSAQKAVSGYAETSLSTSGKRSSLPMIYSHVGLRGLAALCVFMGHLYEMQAGAWGLSKSAFRFFHWAGEAVDLFFILSGFILSYVYLSGESARVQWKSYCIARFARIAPLYYLTLFLSPHKLGIFAKIFVMFPIYSYWFGFEFISVTLLNLTMLAGVLGDWTFSVNPPSWSISVEVLLYITVFPLLAMYARHAGKFLMISISCAFAILLFFCHGEYTFFPSKLAGWNWTYLGRGVFGFTIGFFLCSLVRAREVPNVAESNSVRRILLYAILPIVYLLSAIGHLPSSALVFIFPFLVYYTASDQGFLARILKQKICQWLGERSYSLYMWHFPIMAWYGRLPDSFVRAEYPLSGIVNTTAMTAVVLLISDLSYRYVEMPSRDFIRRCGRGQWKFPLPRCWRAPA